MLKFIRGKAQQPSTERQKIQRELFAFRKTIQHGFPNKPTCLAWDPVLRLMAIGTATGAIKVVGKPGVEFYGHHTSSDHHITHLLFVPNEGRLISLCDDNSLHLWEINDTSMEEVKANKLEGKLNKITVMRLESSGRHLLLGLEGGNVNLLNVATFEFSSAIIFQDKIVQSVEEDYKINPGAVEAIEEQPGNPDNVLIGYNRGLMVLWNRKTSTAQQTFISSQQLESVSWEADGKQFVTSHNDGSYAYWDAAATGSQANNSKPLEEPSTPYGPFPCKAITKIVWTHDATQPTQDLLLFSGGMTRASYGDKNTITALRGRHISEGKHVIFDFTSKIIDFFTISAPDGEKGVCALIVLAEVELVAIEFFSI
ncbi:hypothetical protein LSTR_LSTR013143 [Laodelphax striatellus]|uniref:Lethal giant larvae homologue 2 domain-containing protein n=1 Tax=Laodelphax striatellus TaxID=195883 RepID=A0A482XQV0_LAOST|nr:hypothetical protein LSTR_LSTR013143 [Laodelphax striatellus]